MEEQCIRILLIEDNPGDVRLLQELLQEATSVQFQLESVDRLSQGLHRLSQQSFDVILLDLTLPDSQTLETFVKLHGYAPEMPIVVITGLNDETLALQAVQQGAQDYLVKGQVSSDLLTRSIRYAIERKRTEQTMAEQAALLDIATDAILVRDLDSKILFWNKGAERLYGWKAEEAIGQKASELLYKSASSQSTSPQFQEAQKHLIEAGEWYGELHHVNCQGQAIVVASRWSLVRDKRGQPASILMVSSDITEKKQFEAQFLRAQRMESIGTLASGIAHDLNNILTPILANAQLLQMKLPDLDPRNRQMLKTIEVNTRRGATLVQQVLSFARGVEGKHTVLQIQHVIWEIQQIIEQTFPKFITVQTEMAKPLWIVTGNSTQLHQVLMNLCVNARDAMPEGGTLRISAENVGIDEPYARMNLDAKAGAYVVVTVADTGTGIPPEIVDRMFEPFFTTKEVGKGTGLGLSTAIGIIKSHSGFVEVTSAVGKGTQFKIFLPAVNATKPADSPAPAMTIGQGELILVVDDEAPIREVCQLALEAHGYRALTVADGLQAVTLYGDRQNEISLVLVDMMMPTMDGATTIRTLQDINPQVKIIVASGLASSAQLITGERSAVQAFLPKPYTAEELVNTVSTALQTEG